MGIPAVKTEDLGKSFGATRALASLSMEVAEGEVVGFLGPNGAGKTTTLRLLIGSIRPTTGRAEIFGLDARTEAVLAHRKLSYLAGDTNLWPSLTGGETLNLLERLSGRVDRNYRDDLIERFDLDPSKKVRTYSKGNRQKVALIASLMARSDLLILDEPTSGLDPLLEREFRNCIVEAKRNGQSVLLSSHILSEVEALCDRVGMLNHGRLIDFTSLKEMRQLTSRSVDVTFESTPPDLSRIPGVASIEFLGNSVHFAFRGRIAELLDLLAGFQPESLLIREPSLEELFLDLYDDSPAERG